MDPGQVLFDFFGNCEYFEDKFEYDKALKLPVIRIETGTAGGEGGDVIDKIDLNMADELVSKKEIDIDEDGMRIDRELYIKKFEEKILSDDKAQEIYEIEGISGVLEYAKKEVMNKPSEFFTPSKLRKSIIADRWISFKEIMQKIFGEIRDYKKLDEKTNDEFDKFQDIEKLDPEITPAAKSFFTLFLHDENFRAIIESKEYPKLRSYSGVDYEEFRKIAEWKTENDTRLVEFIPSYVHDYVGDLREFKKV